MRDFINNIPNIKRFKAQTQKHVRLIPRGTKKKKNTTRSNKK